MPPHNLQWCLRRATLNCFLQRWQNFTSLSAIQGTKLLSKAENTKDNNNLQKLLIANSSIMNLSENLLWLWVDYFFTNVKPHGNGQNIVGCDMLRLYAHIVACCCMLLGVVVQSLKLVKLLAMANGHNDSQQCVLGVVGQQCCTHLHGALKIKAIFCERVIYLWGISTLFAIPLSLNLIYSVTKSTKGNYQWKDEYLCFFVPLTSCDSCSCTS